MFGKILLGLAGVLVVFLAVVARRPAAYHVERKLPVAAPAEVVFGVLSDLRQFVSILVLFGSPFDTLDPGTRTTFEGPAAGVGQSYSWSGRKAGKGKLTIEQAIPGQKVAMKLQFLAPMATTAVCALSLADTPPTGSLVTWSMEGSHNFVGKAMGMFMNIDRALGADLEKGLARLEEACLRRSV